jgi:hypothetical protein
MEVACLFFSCLSTENTSMKSDPIQEVIFKEMAETLNREGELEHFEINSFKTLMS